MITICNLRNERMKFEYDVIVDRASILGNIYYMYSEEQRDEVCDKYEEYFNKQVKENIKFKNELDRLINIYNKYGELRLFCWCYPRRCHAITIKNYILQNCN